MLYAIISTDVADSLQLRNQVRPAHLARLRLMQQEGRLVIAGPHPNTDSENPAESGFSGSLVIAEFPSLLEAKEWAACDPYQLAGVYANVIVKPFKKVLPE